MKEMSDEKFQKIGEDKGEWVLYYGDITEEIDYINENYVNESYTIGYSKVETKKNQILSIFYSKTEEGEVITSIGLPVPQKKIGSLILNSTDISAAPETYYSIHTKTLENMKVIADKKEMETQLKKKNLPEKLYQIIKKEVEEHLVTIQNQDYNNLDEKAKKYLSFVEEKFDQIGKGKGEWTFTYSKQTEKIKFKNENYMNQDGDLGYCKISRDDGIIAHAFVSKIGRKEFVTSSGLRDMLVEFEDLVFNIVNYQHSLDTHHTVHLRSLQDKEAEKNKEYLKKQLNKSDFPDRLYSLFKKAILKTIGLANLWSSENIDNIIRKYLEKRIKDS
ncbi:MAG TPA: hypothetical protein DHW82_07715 [Spirochaetia bacterium]|nr:MAG: hypothetical protein A2Y41_02405 [Spirochaetes bacterium GWB1_36_13]HCL56881.1 hypothetical protein [Spirochaetia bacterium]